MTAASDGVCIGRRIDLAAAACAARSTSAVRSPRAYPSAFRAAAAATSALDTGVPRASAIVLTTAPRASAASGIRSSHAWSSRPAARTASWRDSGDVAVANNATRRPRRKSATSAMTSPTISPGPPPGASAPPPPAMASRSSSITTAGARRAAADAAAFTAEIAALGSPDAEWDIDPHET